VVPGGVLPRCLGIGFAAAVLAASVTASAACPHEKPGDPVCDPYVALAMPTVSGAAYFPTKAGGPYVGGGAELAFASWSSNNDTFGPSHGRIYGGANVLTSFTEARRVVLYRIGAVVSFERNASRRFMIPHFGAAIGGLWETRLGTRAAFDASLGFFLVHLRRFVLDAEGGVVMPFASVDRLFGPRTQLTASFALW
jgi:hypothetical protein